MNDMTWEKFFYDFAIIGLTSGLVSGLLLDYFIRRREDRRWQPIKQLLYVALLNILEDLFEETFPITVDGKSFYAQSFKVYAFGAELFSKLMREPSRQFSLVDTALMATLHHEWLGDVEFQRKFHPEQAHPVPPPPQLAALEAARGAIQDQLQTYGAVFDAKLRRMIGQFSFALARAIECGSSPNLDWLGTDSEFYLNGLIFALGEGVKTRAYIRTFGTEYPDIRAWVDDRSRSR